MSVDFVYDRQIISEALSKVQEYPDDLLRLDFQTLVNGMSSNERVILGVILVNKFERLF